MAEGTLKDEKRRERAKFSSMNKEQKISYIKTYYLGPIVVAIAVLMFVIWFILETVVFHKEVLLSGCTVNVKISDETKSYLTDELLEYLGGDSKKQVVNLNADNYVDYSKDDSAPYGEGMNGYMDQTMLFTQIAAGDFAYMILDESALLNIGESEYFGALQARKEWFTFQRLLKRESTMLRMYLHLATQLQLSAWARIRWEECLSQSRMLSKI